MLEPIVVLVLVARLVASSSSSAFEFVVGSVADEPVGRTSAISDGGYLVSGISQLTTKDIVLVKLDYLGGIEWARRVEASGDNSNYEAL